MQLVEGKIVAQSEVETKKSEETSDAALSEEKTEAKPSESAS